MKMVNNWAASNLSDVVLQLYAIIWSRNGIAQTRMGLYRHADVVDSVRLAIQTNRKCRYF